MKKLLLGLALAGFWCNPSKSSVEGDSIAEKARKAVAHELARYESEKITGFYANEFNISLKNEKAQIAKLVRDVNDLQFHSSKIDDKNGALILELERKCAKAREAYTRAIQDLEMGLGPTKNQVPSAAVIQ